MKDAPQNELLSAYLDGELTAEEQAEVEQLLAANPAARQLVDELRALSSSLQALPTHQIGEDISADVLRLAEQAKADERAAAAGPKRAGVEPEGPVWQAMIRRFTRPRNWAWAGVAVAVALLLLVTQSEWLSAPGGREIAMDNVAEERSVAAPEAAAAFEAGEPADADMPAEYPTEAADADMPAEYPPVAEPAPYAMKRGREDLAVGKESGRKGAPEQEAPAPAGLRASRALSQPQIAQPAEAPAVDAGDAFGGMGVGRRVAKGEDTIEVQRPGNGRPRKDQSDYAMKEGEARYEFVEQEPSAGAKADQPAPEGQPPAPALVVSYWVTPAAFQELAFERLLQQQGIRPAVAAGPRGEDVRLPATTSERGQAKLSAAEAKPASLRQVVDVEATGDQLAGLMLSVQNQQARLSFAYAVPGLEGAARQDERSRAALDWARSLLEVQGPDGGQRQLNRAEVDKLLELAQWGEAQDEMRRQAGVGLLANGQRPPERPATPLDRAPGDVEPSAELMEQNLPSKPKQPEAFGVAGVGRARASTPRGAAPAGQAAGPAQTPAPLEVAAPTEPAPEMPTTQMAVQAQQSQANEREAVAEELPEGQDATRDAPKLVRKQIPLAEPERAKQPGPSVPGEEPDRYVRIYRVRFEFHLVDRPGNVAASIAQDAVKARMSEEPPMAMEAAEGPPAAAAPAVEEQP